MTLEQTKGMVLRIERSSIHDGDGMRTVVFLKDARFAVSGVPRRKVRRFKLKRRWTAVNPMERK